ncbi:MAG: type IV pilus modification protein PilV [Methyloprofundus sp.]|nr:type IV pilus modification protein PilV [Methyloprofundus sp.]
MNTKSQNYKPANYKAAAGFSLMEVLIVLVIATVAILGVTKMQLSSLVNVGDAAQRSQATTLAYEMIDRIRANQGNLAAYAGKTVGYGQTALSSPGTTAASNSARAQIDLYQWEQKLNLTGGRKNIYQATGNITRSGNVFTVKITWKTRSTSHDSDFLSKSVSTTTEF